MHQPNRLVKAAVLASSILLVGVLVAYRANAFNERGEADLPRERAATNQEVYSQNWDGSVVFQPLPDLDANPFNPPRSALEEAAVQRPPVNGFINGMASEPDGIYISSPKSGPIFVPSEPSASGSGSTIMYGSNDGFVLTSPNFVPAASGSGSTFIYSSKSGTILPPPSPVQTVTGGTVMAGSKSDRVFVPQKSARNSGQATMMSSSKSFILTSPASQDGQQTQQTRKRPAPNTSQAAARSR
jgi:hypothetical protein